MLHFQMRIMSLRRRAIRRLEVVKTFKAKVLAGLQLMTIVRACITPAAQQSLRWL